MPAPTDWSISADSWQTSRVSPRISRRQALKDLGAAGAGLAFTGGVIRGQGRTSSIAGKPVEIAVSSVSPITVANHRAADRSMARRHPSRSPARCSREFRPLPGAAQRQHRPRSQFARASSSCVSRFSTADHRRSDTTAALCSDSSSTQPRPACRFCCRMVRCSASAKAACSSTRRARPIRCATAR